MYEAPPSLSTNLLLKYNGPYRANAISLNSGCNKWFLSFTLYFLTEILRIQLKIYISRFTSFQSTRLNKHLKGALKTMLITSKGMQSSKRKILNNPHLVRQSTHLI